MRSPNQIVTDSETSNMTKVLAIIAKCSVTDAQIIKKVVQSVFKVDPTISHLEDGGYNGEYDVVLTFGEEAFKACVNDLTIYPLPEPSRLTDKEENQDAREYTWEKLNQAKAVLDLRKPGVQNNSLTEESLPPIAANDVAQLAKINPNGWVGKTKNGRTIRLSARPTEEGSEDIKLTFSELYALKVATELLGVKEFTLVPSHKADTDSGSQ